MRSSQTHLPSLLSSLLFIVGATLFFSVALIMGITAISTLLTGKNVQAQQTIILVVSAFEAVILLAAAFISIQRFRNQPFAVKESSFNIAAWQIGLGLLATAIVIFIGFRIGAYVSFNWLLLPALTVPAVALPIFILLGLGIRGIPLGARWRSWSVFGIAMTLTPFILVFLEVFVLFVVVIVVAAFLASQPDFITEVERLSQQIYQLGPQPEAMQNLLLPYATKPGVIAIALLYFSLLVPMMEEIFKPLGVWLFANKLTSAAQGFALGALSGSAYALIETLGVSAQTEGWATLLLSRIGTGALHITTSALMGAAIFYAFHERRYVRLLGIYLLSIFLHGLWNALAILYGYATLTQYLHQPTLFNGLQTPLSISMVILGVVLFIILVLSNRRMRTMLPKPIMEEPIP